MIVFSFSLWIFPKISEEGIELGIFIIFETLSSVIRKKLFKIESNIKIAF